MVEAVLYAGRGACIDHNWLELLDLLGRFTKGVQLGVCLADTDHDP